MEEIRLRLWAEIEPTMGKCGDAQNVELINQTERSIRNHTKISTYAI